jgi:hypothetical protein
MRRAMFAWAGIGLLLLAAGCSMCAHPFDYCGPVYDGPCTSCGACGGGCGQCGDGAACDQGCGSCGGSGQSDNGCYPCVARAGSVLGGAAGVVPGDMVVEGEASVPAGPSATPGAPVIKQPPAEGPAVGAAPGVEPMIQGGGTIEQEPVIRPVPSSGARLSPRTRPLR